MKGKGKEGALTWTGGTGPGRCGGWRSRRSCWSTCRHGRSGCCPHLPDPAAASRRRSRTTSCRWGSGSTGGCSPPTRSATRSRSRPRSSTATASVTGSPSPGWPTTPVAGDSPVPLLEVCGEPVVAKNSPSPASSPRSTSLRHLKLPAEVFPVSVHLLYQVRPTPPPGSTTPGRPDGPDPAVRARHILGSTSPDEVPP